MRPLSAAQLLGTWEQALVRPAHERALALLAAACPDTAQEELGRLTIGQRDRRLLKLREWTFGPRLVSQASCPRCDERLQMSFDTCEITVGEFADGEFADGGQEPLSLSDGDYEVEFRIPNSHDLAALAVAGDAVTKGQGQAQAQARGRRQLLERCLLAARRRGRKVSAGKLPKRVVRAMVERMTEADPQADVKLDLRCPACEHRWQPVFDIAAFFWIEIDAWARRLLREVHTLAAAYGWAESEILALTPWRRQCYLEMVLS